ncbi:unnamed protein product, partial [Laminaria digitata]
MQGKYAEAEPLYARCQAIEEKALGPEHPSLATTLNNRAGLLGSQVRAARNSGKILLLAMQCKFEEADPLCLRAIEIGEKTLGPDHPSLATRLNNRGWLSICSSAFLALTTFLLQFYATFQGKYEEAGPLYERSLAIREKALGPDHPDVAQ